MRSKTRQDRRIPHSRNKGSVGLIFEPSTSPDQYKLVCAINKARGRRRHQQRTFRFEVFSSCNKKQVRSDKEVSIPCTGLHQPPKSSSAKGIVFWNWTCELWLETPQEKRDDLFKEEVFSGIDKKWRRQKEIKIIWSERSEVKQPIRVARGAWFGQNREWLIIIPLIHLLLFQLLNRLLLSLLWMLRVLLLLLSILLRIFQHKIFLQVDRGAG
ncbi:uncharacterized protein LOC109846569 [Asparagus officinalis]|uniref:uncharacterized protein LOC109846569 n=1 Tax=Asparagus officinalis TaxID=4686 RepID=UPI00098E3A5E|nr:uncharacterized protein LOC109846569 [Asparagus officinalis]